MEVRAYFKETHPYHDRDAFVVWKKIPGKSRNWYLPIINGQEVVDGIHCDNGKSKEYSEGYAGRTATFKLEDGTEDQVQGPWHSNSAAFFEDTGVDMQDKHLTWGVIYTKEIRRDYMTAIIDQKDIYHIDEGWTQGKFQRIEELAQKLANTHGLRMFYYAQSSGGSRQFKAEPNEIED